MFNPATFHRRIRDAFSALHLAINVLRLLQQLRKRVLRRQKSDIHSDVLLAPLAVQLKGHVCDIYLYICI